MDDADEVRQHPPNRLQLKTTLLQECGVKRVEIGGEFEQHGGLRRRTGRNPEESLELTLGPPPQPLSDVRSDRHSGALDLGSKAEPLPAQEGGRDNVCGPDEPLGAFEHPRIGKIPDPDEIPQACAFGKTHASIQLPIADCQSPVPSNVEGRLRSPSLPPMTRTLLTNTRIFDGTGAPIADGQVVIEDGRIAAVGSGLDGDAVIDLGGKALLPG